MKQGVGGFRFCEPVRRRRLLFRFFCGLPLVLACNGSLEDGELGDDGDAAKGLDRTDAAGSGEDVVLGEADASNAFDSDAQPDGGTPPIPVLKSTAPQTFVNVVAPTSPAHTLFGNAYLTLPITAPGQAFYLEAKITMGACGASVARACEDALEIKCWEGAPGQSKRVEISCGRAKITLTQRPTETSSRG